MSSVSSVSSMVIRDLFNATSQLGINERVLCEGAMFYRDSMFDPDKRFPTRVLANLWQHAIDLSKIENFGLRQGQIFNVGVLNTLGFMLMSCADLGGALQEYCKYQKIIGSAIELSLSRAENVSRLSIQIVDPELVGLAEVAESSFATSLICSLRFLSGHYMKPNNVQFSFSQPKHHREYETLFGCKCEFAQKQCQVNFESSVLELPIIHHNPIVKQALKDIIDPLLRGLADPKQKSITTAVFDLFQRHGVSLKIDDAAARLKLSTRSLQTKLASEQSSFKILLRQYQESLARHLLSSQDLAIADIAYLLGYSEHTNFSRAFASWTGVSPKQYRDAAILN
jgi:AraC-like DNA-binding protein